METNSYARSEQTSQRTEPQTNSITAAQDLTKLLFDYITAKPKTSFLNASWVTKHAPFNAEPPALDWARPLGVTPKIAIHPCEECA